MKYKYPLGKYHSQHIQTSTNVLLSEITLDSLINGKISSNDIRISRKTLLIQAEIAEENGFHQLAGNFQKAAELVHIPDEQILDIYNALRPKRSTYKELMSLAADIEEQHSAPEVAKLIRDAANAYRATDLVKS